MIEGRSGNRQNNASKLSRGHKIYPSAHTGLPATFLSGGTLSGFSVYNQRSGNLNGTPGPIFSNIVLADEINRATPKTQSALLEAMAEEQVTVEGVSRGLPLPFMVIATQNPTEHHGTYPLPESQLDRFMMRLHIGYPSLADERKILRDRESVNPLEFVQPVMTESDVSELQRLAAEVAVTMRWSKSFLHL